MTRLFKLMMIVGIVWLTAGYSFASSSLHEVLAANANPSFEADPAQHRGAPTGWSWYGPADVLTLVNDTPLLEPGRNAVQIDYRGRDVASDLCWSDMAPIDPDRPAIVSGWLKTSGLQQGYGGTIAWRFYDHNTQPIPPKDGESETYLVKHSGARIWTYYSQVLTPDATLDDGSHEAHEIPSNARYMSLGFWVINYTDRAWFDGVRWESFRPSADGPSLGRYRSAHAAKMINPPDAIDGRIDAAWRTSGRWEGDFKTTICAPELVVPAKNDTQFKIGIDERNVYIAIVCRKNGDDTIVAERRERNSPGIFSDDTVEVYLDASGGNGPVYHATINPAGSLHEEWSGAPTVLATDIAVEVSDDRWVVELVVPRARLAQFYQEASTSVHDAMWLVNVARQQPKNDEDRYTSWSYTGIAGFMNRDGLSPLLFESEQKVLVERLTDLSVRFEKTVSLDAASLSTEHPVQVQDLYLNIRQLRETQSLLLRRISDAKQISAVDFLRTLNQAAQADAGMLSLTQRLKSALMDLPEDRAAHGYVLFKTPLLQRPRADQLPLADALIDGFSLQLAGNEMSTGTFSIFTKVELTDVALDWTDLASATGHLLPQSAVDLRIAHTWGKWEQADILATDLRIPFNGWLSEYHLAQRFVPRLDASTSQKFYVTVRTGIGTQPGIYRGEIRIAPGNRPATVLPITVEVLPFDLPEADHYVGFYYDGILEREGQPDVSGADGTFYSGLTSDESYLAEMKALRDGGFNTLILLSYADGPMNPEYVRRMLEPIANLGFTRIILTGSEHLISVGLPKTPEVEAQIAANRQTLNTRVAEIYRIAAELGLDDKLYIYGYDEPADEDGLMRNRMISEIVHANKGKIATAVIFRDVYNSIYKQIDLTLVNWGFLTSELTPGETPVQYSGWDGPGRPTLMYYSNLMANQTAMARTVFGWYLHKSGLSGNAPWAWYSLGPGWDPFVEQFSRTPACYVFPTKDQPIPTLKYIATIEGVTDLRYITLLQKRIADAGDREKAAAAEHRLTEMLDLFEYANNRGERSNNFLIPPEQLEKNRSELQHLILSLE